MTWTEVVQIMAGFVGSLGFAILFNIRGKRLAAAAVGGLFSWLLYVLLSDCITGEVVVYFVVACIISLYAELMAVWLKTPTTTFIITSLIPLIPGSSLYYTMTSAFQSDPTVFLQRATHTLQLAVALALGIIAVTTLARLSNRVLRRLHRQ
ncbi:MAG: threonine/serine exporter [Ruminococcaceae bacterium]|nr:threonine/serine exporter [Oscillospiraceae bacterium]